MNRIRTLARAVAVASTVAVLGGCATSGGAPASRVDPLEPLNRAAFAFNEPLDRDVVKPIVRAYVENVPRPIRQIATNFFGNIEDFFSGVNGMLQNKPDKAGHDFGRVVVNSLFGLGGLIDFASEAGIPKGDEDFGQTFGVWGMPAGPYLFIPLLGPSTGRDMTGFVVRFLVSPVPEIENDVVRWALYGIGYLDVRSQLLEAQSLAAQAALDPYTFVRRSYLQRREYLIYDGKPPPPKDDE
jgi:phospholipid-binding lipoprotein MlaA